MGMHNVIFLRIRYHILYNSLPDPNQMIGHARSRVIHLLSLYTSLQLYQCA